MRSTKAVIYMDNLRSNLKTIRSCISKTTKMCVSVKADGYGHGAVPVAKAAVECGAEFLAVATIDEGIELRNAGITADILVLSLCTPEEMKAAVTHSLTPFVFDSEYISLFDKAAAGSGKRFSVHLAVDTGMGRIGCLPEDAAEFAKQIASSKHLVLGGMCTHFAVSDSLKPGDPEYTVQQFSLFKNAVNAVKKAGIQPGICHCSSSAAFLATPEMQMDMIRPGIIVYGYYPDQISREYLENKGVKFLLKPVMALETAVVAIRPFTPGRSVSYGRTWTASENTDIAVLPVGYADGLLRRCSPGLSVAVNGSAYPVRGRICMDQCMVDIGRSNTRVKRWDTAVLFGPSESGALQTADDIARATGTIPYEILTSVSRRVTRVYR